MANPYNVGYGVLTGDGTAKTVTLGYRPVSVKVLDETNNIVWEVIDGMASTYTLRQTIASPSVLSTTTNSDVAITATGFTLSATAHALLARLVYVAPREEA